MLAFGRNLVQLEKKNVPNNNFLLWFKTVPENDFIFRYTRIYHGFGTVLNGLKNRTCVVVSNDSLILWLQPTLDFSTKYT